MLTFKKHAIVSVRMESITNTTESPQQLPELQHVDINQKPSFWMISTIVLLLITLGGGSFIILQKRTRTSNQPSQKASQQPPIPTKIQNEITNWKVYKTDKYELKYPSLWKIPSQNFITTPEYKDGYSNISYDGTISIIDPAFYEEPKNKTATLEQRNRTNETPHTKLIRQEQKVINNYQVKIFDFEEAIKGVTLYRKSILVEKQKNEVWEIIADTQMTDALKRKDFFDKVTKIFSTFIFTDQSQLTSCNLTDKNLCKIIEDLKKIIANKETDSLLKYQNKQKVECNDSILVKPIICEEVPNGQSVEGYAIARNQSEGSVYSESKYKELFNSLFVNNTTYNYHGSLFEDDKGIVVFLDIPESNLLAFSFKKTDNKWQIEHLITGLASEDYKTLNKVILTFF